MRRRQQSACDPYLYGDPDIGFHPHSNADFRAVCNRTAYNTHTDHDFHAGPVGDGDANK